MKEIKDLRFKIDEIDKKLLVLIVERLQFVKKIGEIKRKNGIEVIDRERETQILSGLMKEAENSDLDPKIVIKVWKVLMEISYDLEGEKNGNS